MFVYYFSYVLKFRYTAKGTAVFALMTEWPENDEVTLHAPIPIANTAVSMLGYPGKIPWYGKISQPGLRLDIHGVRKQPCQWAWVFRLENVQ